MANIRYRRFRNTSEALSDCVENWFDDDIDQAEHNARRHMILKMIEVLNDMGASVSQDDIDPDFMERRNSDRAA